MAERIRACNAKLHKMQSSMYSCACRNLQESARPEAQRARGAERGRGGSCLLYTSPSPRD
eukprot:2916302-Alexandrium_andersonii.AAC.1